MISFLNPNKRPIGLEIGSNCIRMIQFACRDQKLRVLAAEKTRIDPDIKEASEREAFIVSKIKEMLIKGRFSGREVISSLPDESVRIKNLRLEIQSQRGIPDMVADEASQRFGLNPDDDEIRHVVAGKVYHGSEVKVEVILFGAEKPKIAEYVRLLEKAGLNPVSLDVMPLALFRSFQNSLRRHEDKQIATVFVDIGEVSTTVLIGRGNRITFVKVLPVASRNFDEQIASMLGVNLAEAAMLRMKLKKSGSDNVDSATKQTINDAVSQVAKDLVREVSLCFQYYSVTFRGERPAEAVCAGSQMAEDAVLDALGSQLGVSIKIAQPLRAFDLSKTSLASCDHVELSEWAGAVGLGIKGCDFLDYGIENHDGN